MLMKNFPSIPGKLPGFCTDFCDYAWIFVNFACSMRHMLRNNLRTFVTILLHYRTLVATMTNSLAFAVCLDGLG